jgi:uncharacterized DUF497 family protein
MASRWAHIAGVPPIEAAGVLSVIAGFSAISRFAFSSDGPLRRPHVPDHRDLRTEHFDTDPVDRERSVALLCLRFSRLALCIFMCILQIHAHRLGRGKASGKRPQARFDFADAEAVLSGITHVFEDDRFAYYERRFITLGLLKDTVVYIVHADDAGDIRVISMRKATRYEEGLFFRNI